MSNPRTDELPAVSSSALAQAKITGPLLDAHFRKRFAAQAGEFLLIVKSTARRLKELEKEIARTHSYEAPEFLVLRVDSGSRSYLEWLAEAVSRD